MLRFLTLLSVFVVSIFLSACSSDDNTKEPGEDTS